MTDSPPVAADLTALIGRTPLLQIASLSREAGCEILAKLEFFNPLSSVKDRIALAMVEAAVAAGELAPGGLIIEATSGNTGIGLAFVAVSRGFRLALAMPESMSLERRRLLQALGAELHLTPAAEGMNGALARAEKLHRESPGSFMARQFANPANPEIHRRTTAREIFSACGGRVNILVAGVGTGGTITGCALGLRESCSGLQVVAVEPAASAVLSGRPAGKHGIQGIGAGFVPEVLRVDLLDEVVTVTDEEAFDRARRLAREEGILVGISSGAAAAAAVKIGSRPKNRGKRLVVIFPDGGERYLSTPLFTG